MNLKTSTIDGKIMDIISEEEYLSRYDLYGNNPSISSATAVEVDDGKGNKVVLPFRGKTDDRPGVYPDGSVYYFKLPMGDVAASPYNVNNLNIVDLTNIKSVDDFLNKNEQIREMETNVLTDIDSVFVPRTSPEDDAEMKAFKEAIISKHIDIGRYAYRFGDNFLNDKRILNGTSITMNKLKEIGKKLDIEVEIILRDKNPDVPNPMNKTISTVITDVGGDEDE